MHITAKRNVWLLIACLAVARVAAAEPAQSSAAIFEKRIMPIFQSTKPSSCIECHLSGVDLKNYILPSAEKTFISLRDQGLVDLDKPESSRILALISMGESAKEPSLIKDSMRSQEYRAFADWIVASSREPALRNAPKLAADELARPARPAEVIRHARKDQVLDSFERNIWSQRFRCATCHAPGGTETARLIKEQGGDDFLWIEPEAPAATMRRLMERQLIDVKRPEMSLLLRKPTNQAKHGGGKKMEVGDIGYKAFRSWLEDYARTVENRYERAAELPTPSSAQVFGSEQWLKIQDTPPEWGDRLLQISIYAFDETQKTWESDPVAMSDRAVWGKGKLWQHSLYLVAPRGSERANSWQQNKKPKLPPGRYLLKVFVDRDGRLAQDWKASMGEREFVGQVEIQSDWPSDYGKMTVIQARKITAPRLGD